MTINKNRIAFGAALLVVVTMAGSAAGQPARLPDPASLAFEEGRWADAIGEFRRLLDSEPDSGLNWLRIAQAERELGRHEAALETLAIAEAYLAPEAMVHTERARNLLGLGRTDEALAALDTADHFELRSRQLLEQAAEFDPIREDSRFQRVYRNVRARVHPCENLPEAAGFDFWLGDWEVRDSAGALLGYNTISRDEGGCVVNERWRGLPGSSGASMTFYLPSRGQWRHVWIGSGGTHIDMTGGPVDGSMRLEGTIEYLDRDQVIAFRTTWSPSADGSVRQLMEQFNLVSQTWGVWYDGYFRRLD